MLLQGCPPYFYRWTRFTGRPAGLQSWGSNFITGTKIFHGFSGNFYENFREWLIHDCSEMSLHRTVSSRRLRRFVGRSLKEKHFLARKKTIYNWRSDRMAKAARLNGKQAGIGLKLERERESERERGLCLLQAKAHTVA